MATPTEHVPPAIRQASSFLRTIYGQTPEKMEGIPHYEAARLIYHQNLNRSFSHRLSEKFACTSNIDQAADLECGRNTEDAAVSRYGAVGRFNSSSLLIVASWTV